jgi:hypothetical protein
MWGSLFATHKKDARTGVFLWTVERGRSTAFDSHGARGVEGLDGPNNFSSLHVPPSRAFYGTPAELLMTFTTDASGPLQAGAPSCFS